MKSFIGSYDFSECNDIYVYAHACKLYQECVQVEGKKKWYSENPSD